LYVPASLLTSTQGESLNRAADPHGLRYPGDLSGSEWALIEPEIPPGQTRWASPRHERPRGSEHDVGALDEL